MKKTFLFLATGFWLVMTSLLIQREFFQVSVIQSGYEVLSLDLESREEYSAILLGKERIGFSFTVLETKKDSPEAPYELRHQTYLSFLFLGHEREMLVQGNAQLDRGLRLKGFNFKISSSQYWTRIQGEVSESVMKLIFESNDGKPTEQQVPLSGPLYFSEALRFLWTPENLKPGKKGTLTVWNPLLGGFQTVSFHVKEKTVLEDHGKPVPVYLIQMNTGGIDTKSWVSTEGVVLREEGVTGVTSIKEEGWEIFDAIRKKKSRPPDLPNLFSIPSSRPIEKPQELTVLKVKIKNEKEEKVLSVKKPDLNTVRHLKFPLTLTPGAFEKELESNQWVEAQDPEIIEKAKEITRGSESALEAVLKIMNWVHETISPVPSMSLPQSKKVLAIKKGDCNEYAVLFTAFTRALGIPTKMIAGLVYQNGRFYYHAWSEVYLDRWIAVDPTFAQAPADVTHIPLIEGNLEEQVGLVRNLGKVHLIILETA